MAKEFLLVRQGTPDNSSGMSSCELRPYTSEDQEWLVAQHQALYTRDEGFDESFGPLVRRILVDFETCSDPLREFGWIAWKDDRRVGSIFCVSKTPSVAKLRLFLVLPEMRGSGLASRLLHRCREFAGNAGYTHMTLWTHESHKAACALYKKTGWNMTSSKSVVAFGVPLVEQQWDVSL